MVLVGIVLIVLGLFGVMRGITLPAGVIAVVLGAIIDVVYLFGHTLALVF